jgi:hypothetical protein
MFVKMTPANCVALAVAGYFMILPAFAEPEHYGASALGKNKPKIDGWGTRTINIKSSDCLRLQKYVAAPDVAYQSGVAKDGGKLAPADISPAPGFGKTDNLNFSFTVRLNNALPTGTSGSGDILGEAPIGNVEYRNGVVSFNGVPLSDDQLQAVSAGCSSALKDRNAVKKYK